MRSISGSLRTLRSTRRSRGTTSPSSQRLAADAATPPGNGPPDVDHMGAENLQGIAYTPAVVCHDEFSCVDLRKPRRQ
jgi:hypothetical protein